MMSQTETSEVDGLRQILQQQARIALVNYDAAHCSHESVLKLIEIVGEQSRRIDALIGTVAQLLEALENNC